MTEQEIICLWLKGYSKHIVAKMYERCYNQRVKVIRYDMKFRNEPFISYRQALAVVERTILKELQRR